MSESAVSSNIDNQRTTKVALFSNAMQLLFYLLLNRQLLMKRNNCIKMRMIQVNTLDDSMPVVHQTCFNMKNCENCDALTVVKMNRLIWVSVSSSARTTDRKLQHVEESIIKGATILVNLDYEYKDGQCGTLIDQCNDVLALLGHANRQVNMARKDFLRPEFIRVHSSM